MKDIFNSDTISYGYCSFPLDDDTTTYISLDICGGGIQDTLYTDKEGRTISKHILKSTFGDTFQIWIKDEEMEHSSYSSSIEIVEFDYSYSLYMQGFPKNMKEIKEELFGISKKK